MTPQESSKLPSTLSVDEVTRLIETPDTSKPLGMRNRAILEVMYATGLRVSELIEIKLGICIYPLVYCKQSEKGQRTNYSFRRLCDSMD